eukprot:TRINITY_DN2965_c0_g1_i1.p1 TRINITY_DN2965_c0_g1~~TRINITY_DN2965_c0_g1_i1.p1  ORF type:complete len:215 (+),score=46.85 TRINITY_DN2965_c0_g1_i1:126-770(+)
MMCTPCDSRDQGARQMKMIDLEPNMVLLPDIEDSTFIQAMTSVKPSVNKNDLEEYEKFTKLYGLSANTNTSANFELLFQTDDDYEYTSQQKSVNQQKNNIIYSNGSVPQLPQQPPTFRSTPPTYRFPTNYSPQQNTRSINSLPSSPPELVDVPEPDFGEEDSNLSGLPSAAEYFLSLLPTIQVPRNTNPNKSSSNTSSSTTTTSSREKKTLISN